MMEHPDNRGFEYENYYDINGKTYRQCPACRGYGIDFVAERKAA